MRNRAKCKVCGDIIESFLRHDLIYCRCGEIAIDGGTELLRCVAKNWENFLRIDDEGNEIIPTIINKDIPESIQEKPKDRLELLRHLLKNYENLPGHAMQTPITHYDFCTLLSVLIEILQFDKS